MLTARARSSRKAIVLDRVGASAPDLVRFRCNICDVENCLPRERLTREAASCDGCASTVRMRSVIRCLSLMLFGRSLRLSEMPINWRIHGLGLSDWATYADRLARRFSYRNTFFDAEPQLDITDPPPELFNTLDFLIASDVFEHVAPPVDAAFAGAFRLLKPGGKLIFSVPYTIDATTIEHFPTLAEFEILRFGEEHYLLNRRRDSSYELFDKLVFHGGPGQTLEMRIFCEADVVAHLQQTGFGQVVIHREDDPAVGVVHAQGWSLPMTAVRPIARSVLSRWAIAWRETLAGWAAQATRR